LRSGRLRPADPGEQVAIKRIIVVAEEGAREFVHSS
jgi:hypothetical protein